MDLLHHRLLVLVILGGHLLTLALGIEPLTVLLLLGVFHLCLLLELTFRRFSVDLPINNKFCDVLLTSVSVRILATCLFRHLHVPHFPC